MAQIISRLRLWQKFTLIGLVALIMAVVSSSLLIEHRYQELIDTQTELAGLKPAQDLIQLIQLTQQHRGLSAGLFAGNESFAAEQRAKNEAVSQAIDRASASVATLRDRSGDRVLAELSAKVKQDWSALSTAVQSRSLGGPQSFHDHTALIDTQLALMYRVLDASALTLDPVAATYYLTVALLDHQPTQTELLGQIRAVGSAVLTRQAITPEERLLLQTAVSMAKLHNEKTRALVAKAIEAEPALKPSIGAAMQQAGMEHDEAVRLLREQVLRPGELSYPSKDYFASLTKAIDAEYRLMNAGVTELRSMLEDRRVHSERLLLLLVGSLTGVIVFTLWISFTTVRQANRAVKETLAAAHALARGDLKHPIRVDSRDEFGAIADALGDSMASLAATVQDIKQAITTVNTASAEIALGTEDLSTRTEEQASSLEQTSASMDALSRAVRLNSEHAKQANEMALQACEVARNGGDTVHEVVESMQSINHSSRRIADIIGVIDSIAFQTNILALNASVEAARAGEQGRGFAVVASEVRNLAQRSAQAAQEIKSLITDSVREIETGARQADQAGRTVHGIVEAITRVTTLMAEISQASASQAQGIAQVVEAVTHMDGMTQQNASLVEETAHASRSLEVQASQVAQAMDRFKL